MFVVFYFYFGRRGQRRRQLQILINMSKSANRLRIVRYCIKFLIWGKIFRFDGSEINGSVGVSFCRKLESYMGVKTKRTNPRNKFLDVE